MTDASQPCMSCGRATQPGTPLFSDRTTARTDDGGALFLCGDCNERAVSHFGRRLTPADMRGIAARGAGVAFLS